MGSRPSTGPRPRLDPPAGNGLPDHGVVAVVLVGVRLGELEHRAVEPVARAEVRGKRDGAAGTRVSAGERPAAHLRVGQDARLPEQLELRRPLAVPQLAVVEVAPFRTRAGRPAEEHVAGRLHQALALDDSLPMVTLGRPAEIPLEDRGLGFLDLQEERVLLVDALEIRDQAQRPDAADTDDLAGDVDEAVPIDQLAPVGRQGAPVAGEGAADGLVRELVHDPQDERRAVHDLAAPIDDPGELVERAEAVAPGGDGLQRSREHLAPVGGQDGVDVVDRDVRIPGRQRPGRRQLPEPAAIRGDGVDQRAVGEAPRPAQRTAGDDDARGQALDVPLERPGKRLVEVVDIEHQRSLGRCVDAEVGQVGVTAQLDAEARPGCRGEVRRHDRGGTPIEGEGAGQHPPVADGDELRDASGRLRLEDGDGVRAIRRRLEHAVDPAREAGALRGPERDLLGARLVRGPAGDGRAGRRLGGLLMDGIQRSGHRPASGFALG